MNQLQEYKCPSCGGAIEFNPTAQKMKCPYCDTEFEPDAIKNFNADSVADSPDSMEWENKASEWNDNRDIRIFSCKSCGGEIIADSTTSATSCPFCGNPVTVSGNLSGVLKPDLVIPFKLDKKAAKEALLRHYTGKKLLPKSFRTENHIDEIKGIYVPVWLFDGDADASIRYKATKVRTWSDKSYDYTETSYYSIFREGELSFSSVPVDGSSKMDDTIMEALEPFRLSDAVSFNTAYLAGYFADKYDVSADICVKRANERIKASTEDTFKSTVKGYSSVTSESSSIKIDNGITRYALYPIWLLNSVWNGKRYTFAMNGQTGEFVGDLPIDRGAYWKWFGIYTGIGTAITFAVITLINML